MEGERDNLAWQVGVHREEKQRLQDELQNLQAAPKDADFTKLQESSATIINNLREETRILQSRLATARADLATIQNQLSESQRAPADEHQPATEIELPESADLLNKLKARREKSKVDLTDVEVILELIADGKDLPEAADLYNKLKTKRKKKSNAVLADVEAILELIERE